MCCTRWNGQSDYNRTFSYFSALYSTVVHYEVGNKYIYPYEWFNQVRVRIPLKHLRQLGHCQWCAVYRKRASELNRVVATISVLRAQRSTLKLFKSYGGDSHHSLQPTALRCGFGCECALAKRAFEPATENLDGRHNKRDKAW